MHGMEEGREFFFLSRRDTFDGEASSSFRAEKTPTNLPREASKLVEAPRRSPDEAFFPIPSTLFESAIASRASLLSTFRVLLSYTEKKELLGGTKYV